MINIDKLLQKEILRAEKLKNDIERYKEKCPAIIAVLNSHPSTAYKYFNVYLDDLNSVDSFCSNMFHAMIDDGDYSIVREVDEYSLEYSDDIDHKYVIKLGDHGSLDNHVHYLTESEIIEICRLDRLHYTFYEENEDAIESSGFGWLLGKKKTACSEYFKLARLADKYLESLWRSGYEA